MKFDFGHYGSKIVVGDTIDRLPLFDFYFSPPGIIYQHRGSRFTGEYYTWCLLEVTIFRHKFVWTLEYNHDRTSPEIAKDLFHCKRRLKCK